MKTLEGYELTISSVVEFPPPTEEPSKNAREHSPQLLTRKILQIMNLIDMPREERYAMMRKRHSFLM